MPGSEDLARVLRAGKRLEVFLHDNPDPDAIASGLLLARLAAHLGRKARLFYGGKLGRAENRAMVQLLRIPLRDLAATRVRFRAASDCFALVDTQPGAGNNSFPPGLEAHVVVDHHPLLRPLDAPFVDVRPEEGACTTLVLGHLEALGVELDSSAATAAAYALLSETQDLEREATRSDREAYLRIFPLVRLPLLGRIRHPIRQRSYYRAVARAMRRVRVGKNTCICHIGSVPHADIVSEIADFLMPMELVTWCLVSGFHEGRILLSVRTKHPKARADRVMKKVLGRKGKGGGHNMIAGGAAPCPSLEDYGPMAERFTERFLRALRRKVPERPRPLLLDGGEEDPGVPGPGS